jgi:hypothetical protein
VNRLQKRPWLAVCLLLLALHLALGMLRIPGKLYGRRAEEIARYRSEGAAGYLLGNARLHGAPVIDWLRANVPADAVVLWRGDAKGPFEILAGLIAPRLLVAEGMVAADATSWCPPGEPGGRPLARGPLADGSSGIVVVEARADGLALQVR